MRPSENVEMGHRDFKTTADLRRLSAEPRTAKLGAPTAALGIRPTPARPSRKQLALAARAGRSVTACDLALPLYASFSVLGSLTPPLDDERASPPGPSSVSSFG